MTNGVAVTDRQRTRQRAIRLPALAVALILTGLAPAWAEDSPAPAPPKTAERAWLTLAPLPHPATDLTGAVVNGRLFVLGGRDSARPSGAMVMFDAATGQWSARKAMPVPVHHAAVVSYGDRIYVFGGFKRPESGIGWQPVDLAWEYDPAGDAWKALKPLPVPRGGAAVAAADGQLYVIGGAAPASGQTTIDGKRRHEVLARVDAYDLKTDQWTARAPLPTPRTGAAAAAMTGGIYVIGGRIGSAFANGSDVDVVEAYDPAADRWSAPLARLPAPRGDATATVWRNLILVAGGTPIPEAGESARTLIGFDPGANRWSALPAPPLPRTGFAAGVIGDRFYAVGGEAERPLGAGLGQPVADATPGQRGNDARNGAAGSTLTQAFELLTKPAEPANPAVPPATR
ncbi:MAG: hypothetical protein J0H78_00825 [Rhizobiales bacterium]|nr:hypothetical protein [Hyphomicrobiales bacterium]OJY46111.1 MAG: hypothetical protein BGP08_07225 [Rhizobiales bacterium 64-17]